MPSLSIPEHVFDDIAERGNECFTNHYRISSEIVLGVRSMMREKVLECISGAKRDTVEIFGADAPGELFDRVRESIEPVIRSDPIVFTQIGLANGIMKGFLFQKAHADLSLIRYAYVVLIQRLEKMKRDFEGNLRKKIAELAGETAREELLLKSALKDITSNGENGVVNFQLAAHLAELRKMIEQLKRRVPEKKEELRKKRRQLEEIGRFDFKAIFLEIRDHPCDEVFLRAREMIDDFLSCLRHAPGTVSDTYLEGIIQELMKCEVTFERRKEIAVMEPQAVTKPTIKRKSSMLPMAGVLATLAAFSVVELATRKPDRGSPVEATANLSANANPPDIFRTEKAIRIDIMRILTEHPLRIYFDLLEQGGEKKVFVRVEPYPALSSAPYFQYLAVGFKFPQEEGGYETIRSLGKHLEDDMQQGRYFSLAEFESIRHDPLVATVQYRNPHGETKNFQVGGGVVPIFSPELRIFMEIHESNLPLPPNPYRDEDE